MGVHLFLSPHLDDAVLSCGGMIHHLVVSGERVVIITAMAGEPQTPLPDSTLMRSIKSHWQSADNPVTIRRAEDAQAAHSLGAQIYHLPLPESAFRTTRCGAGDWIPLYPDLDSPFRAFNDADEARVFLFDMHPPFTEIKAIYAPLCVDEHIDHRLVRDWALVLTGSNDAPLLKFYEEYPLARNPTAVQKASNAYGAQTPPLTLTSEVMALTPEDLAAKLKAMGCYQSHFHVLWNDPAEMETLARDYMVIIGDGTPAERFWRVVR